MSYRPRIKIDNELMNFLSDVGGKFTVKDTRAYKWSGYQFISQMREAGLIECNGIQGKHEKVWVLTERGKRAAEHFRSIRECLQEVESEGRESD
jgi:predicted MarR family transcription regulator